MGVVHRRGSLADLAVCKGTCGRQVRPPNLKIAEAPESVPMRKEGYCHTCWDDVQRARPMTRKEIDTQRSLDQYMARRRARLAKLTRSLEQFRKEPIFGELEVEFTTLDIFREVEMGMTMEQIRSKRAVTATESFREGAVKYIQDTQGKWRFSIIGANGEVMSQSEGYATLSNAKRGAKALITRLGITEPDE